MIRIISKDDTEALADLLRKNQLGVTIVDAKGKDGDVKILFSIINRKDLNDILSELNQFNPNIFYTIEDIHTVNKGFFGKASENIKQYK